MLAIYGQQTETAFLAGVTADAPRRDGGRTKRASRFRSGKPA